MDIDAPDPKLGYNASNSGSDDLKPAILVDDAQAKATQKDMSHVRVRYTILDRPSWWECALLGIQTYLTMLGSTVLIPFLIVPPMGGTPVDLAHVIQTIFFVSGIATLLQTVVGDRLPIVQGGSFAYLTPTFAIIAQVSASRDWSATDAADGTNHERFLVTMQEVSGGIIGSALIIFVIGYSGLINLLLRYISPITVAANIAIVGLSLYGSGFTGVGPCVQLGIPMIVFIILFSQYMKNVSIPIPYMGRLRIFELFPILLAIIVTWVYAVIFTEAGVYDNSSPATQAACRTDQSSVLSNVSWFRFPYPGQWGAPTFSWSSVFTMLAGAISACVESLGDYYAAARISGAPVPPPGVLARGVTWQGITCVLTGLWGTGNGTTAYNENIGAMQITGVGSRFVIQVGAGIIIVVALIGKFGGLFASMPNAMVSGLWCVMFSIIAAVGISQLQFTDQNSPRNIFIVGFAIYMSLSIPYYFTTYTTEYGHPPINTGSGTINNVFNAIFETGAAVSLIITLFLDNTIPATREERGLHVWTKTIADGVDWWDDDELHAVYGLPFGLTRKWQAKVKPIKDRFRALNPFKPKAPRV